MLPSKFLSSLSLAVVVTSMTTAKPNTAFVAPVLAQAPTTFPVPSAVPQGTSIRIDGSSSMATINENLKQRFETQFPGTTVTTRYSGSDAALQALSDGKIDLAAIGRPLTPAEKNRGLVSVPLNRGKIAVIVGSENPFNSSLTVPQFIQIVRGEITDWSQVGGQPGVIRFIDRPDLSDTRAAFGTYAVFQQSPYQPSSTAVRLTEDSTRDAIEKLGKDGISFAPANQVTNQQGVRPLLLYNTLPSDPRYPFSQPYYYVYNKTASPAVAAFLGFGTAPDQVLSTFQATEAALNAGRASTAAQAASPNAASPGAPSPSGNSPGAAPNANNPTATTPNNAPAGDAATGGTAPNNSLLGGGASNSGIAGASGTEINGGLPNWLWWLLPIGAGAALLGLLWKGRRSRQVVTERQPIIPPRSADIPPLPPPVGPSVFAGSDVDLATRAGSVITSDRASMRQTSPDPNLTGDAAIVPPLETPEPESMPAVSEDLSADLNGDINAQPEDNRSVSDLLPGAAALGGAALAGAAFTRYRSGNVPDASTTLDIEEASATVPGDSDNLEVATSEIALASGTPISESTELNLDEAPSVIEAVDQGNQALIEADLDQLEIEQPTELNLDEVPSVSVDATQENHSFGTIAAATALGGAGLVAGFASTVHSPKFASEETISSDIEALEDVVESSANGASTETTEPEIESSLENVVESSANGASTEITEPAVPSELPEARNAPENSSEASTDNPFSSSEFPEDTNPISGAGLALGGAAVAAGVAGIASAFHDPQTDVEATKYDVGQTDLSAESLAAVDEGLPELPNGYGDSRIVLMPRDPQWAYAYWDVPNEHREELRRQGGQNLVLRLADVTDLDADHQSPHSVQQFDCDEMTRDWYLPIPVSDRDYVAELGYLTADGHWLMLARSQAIRVPPVYPSDWLDDQFVSINWDDSLEGKTFGNLSKPNGTAIAANGIYDSIFALTQGVEAQRVAGSLFGSMHQVPPVSSFVFPSGMGMWALPTPSGMGMSGINMSGVGFSGSAIPSRPRKFWLVADAELIVYGATEPDATVTIAGQPVPLNSDGTFRFQMSFQDGLIDYPILAVASDGEQTRAIHLKFTRETPRRNTNTKEEATDEWLS